MDAEDMKVSHFYKPDDALKHFEYLGCYRDYKFGRWAGEEPLPEPAEGQIWKSLASGLEYVLRSCKDLREEEIYFLVRGCDVEVVCRAFKTPEEAVREMIYVRG